MRFYNSIRSFGNWSNVKRGKHETVGNESLQGGCLMLTDYRLFASLKELWKMGPQIGYLVKPIFKSIVQKISYAPRTVVADSLDSPRGVDIATHGIQDHYYDERRI